MLSETPPRKSPMALVLGLGLALWLAFAVGPPARATVAPALDRQVLVMLQLPPGHFQPNSDYAGGYGSVAGATARRRIASRIAHDHSLTLVTSWPMPLLGVDCFVMAIPDDQSQDQVVALLARDPAVAWTEPMHVYHAQGQTAGHAVVYNDPLFPLQPAAVQWRLADLHELATGRNVRVAVVDSMIEAGHPDLAGQVQISENFVLDRPSSPEQHGTGVAGIIAAAADNGVGIVGIAPHARLVALRACWQQSDSSTVCDTLSLAKALHFAIEHDVGVINLSLSGPFDSLLARLLDLALARGVTVVGAFDPSLAGGGFPASRPGVIAVVDESGPPAPAGIFRAPGRDIPTTQPGGRWFLVSGNSYAAAHVSGLFALLRERNPRLRNAAFLVSTTPGGGLIDACATLMRGGPSPCGCLCAKPDQYSANAGR